MRRLALLGLAALAGCGGGTAKPDAKPAPARVVKREKAERAERRERAAARKRIRASALPADAQKELEEAQDLLDQKSP